LQEGELRSSVERITALKQWLTQYTPPDLSVVGCAEHAALANEIAQKSITLVRDEARQLPLRLAADARLAVIVPQPKDLTPADTSSYDQPALADALRVYHANLDEVVMPLEPTAAEVAALRDRVAGAAQIIIGTINADQHPGQAALINSLIELGQPVIAVALRMPYDILAYPRVATYLCTYSLQPASLQALAQVLWGRLACVGQLPVELPGR
jgi:beta-N-acetylhexosaminidase